MPLSSLNAEQRAAATAELGKNLVIASAGTGKTSTIVGRIAHLLRCGVSPRGIMLLTFTNKASSEMIKRLESYFPKDILKDILAGTFHAVAYRYLKDSREIALKSPRELKLLLKSVYAEKNLNLNASTPPYKSDYLYDLISLYHNTSSATFADFVCEKNEEQAPYALLYEEVLEDFSALKRRYNYASFDDLLLLYREAVALERGESSGVGDFSEVLVDEYQDTNYLQNSIILSLNAKSLFCVGDYDQSIYAFNGADIGNIAGFKDRFSDVSVFSLSKNYRSSGKILAVANAVIANNPRIYPKTLEVLRENPHSRVEVLAFEDTRAEYRGIARHIAANPTQKSEIAVIFRNNASADFVEISLRELGINAKKRGARSFFESREVSLFIDILSLFHNPQDIMACVNLLSLESGIGEAMAREIFECLVFLGEGDFKKGLLNPKHSANPYPAKAAKAAKSGAGASAGLFDEVFLAQDRARFDSQLKTPFASHLVLCHPKLNAKTAAFLEKLHGLFYAAKALNRRDLGRIFSAIEGSEFFSHIAELVATARAKHKFKETNAAKIREEREFIDKKIKALRGLSQSFDDLGRFLGSIVLNSGESSSGDGVNLLTIHAAKGLEFDDVYVIDLMDGRFPNKHLMAKTGSLEEERRLFYVATTRARHNIFYAFAYRDLERGADYVPSLFLREAKLVESAPKWEKNGRKTDE